ncbi:MULTISPECIES: hypothetical protein [unclassified Acinetobacter]|uniref:hypothetical protein n=1 Tax=unclassified Acinetobacter TaxID=196816 RepID=UPI0029345C7D|nr:MULTISPECIES: hypothetical protein [unclassified Acinetobacter]WOE33262.1 hypothetical protein QSG84_16000 [Acinetobacter sp. SAAs470]WOE36957.1 hypothetical protein QSG86_00885 [Acinetobacter sp. SAAs474]
MSTKKLVIIVIISLIIGGLIGYFISNKTVGRYNIVNATCTTLNVAVDHNMLTAAEIRELGKLTKEKLANSQAANAFKISDKQISAASEYSTCSQFIVGMNE